jgi:hypothetical protein
MNLFRKYGYCVIPKGTLLFRKGDIDFSRDALFFALNPRWVVTVNTYETQDVQLWETKKDIKVLFMIKELNEYGHPKCALTEIYKHFTSETTDLDAVNIKGRDFERRTILIDYLKQNKVHGWLTKIDSGYPLEICLFPSSITLPQIKLKEQSTTIPKQYKSYNALYNVNIVPSKTFVNKTQKNLAGRLAKRSKRKDEYGLFELFFDKKIITNEVLKTITPKKIQKKLYNVEDFEKIFQRSSNTQIKGSITS